MLQFYCNSLGIHIHTDVKEDCESKIKLGQKNI